MLSTKVKKLTDLHQICLLQLDLDGLITKMVLLDTYMMRFAISFKSEQDRKAFFLWTTDYPHPDQQSFLVMCAKHMNFFSDDQATVISLDEIATDLKKAS